MSRVSLIEQLYVKRKNALEFRYDLLIAPPIRSIFSQIEINALYNIATSLRYNGNIEKKYELIDAIMEPKGFRRAHCGTNRVVYNFLENNTFVAKVALDKVGMEDTPAEFKNQEFFKPFCCKIFEVDPSGVIGFIERVNPITSIEEFLSLSDDIFTLMATKIIGKYVVDDLGSEKYMNYGIRYNSNGFTFGPVIIDFPYAYELDGKKLICKKPIKTISGDIPCGGEIDYDIGFNHLVCTKCGRKYTALDLKKNNKNILIMYDEGKECIKMRAKIIQDGKVIADSGISSKNYVSKEDYNRLISNNVFEDNKTTIVSKVKKQQYKTLKQIRKEYYTSLQTEQHNKMEESGLFNNISNKSEKKINSIIKKPDYTFNNDKKITTENITINNTIISENISDKSSEVQNNVINKSGEEKIQTEIASKALDNDAINNPITSIEENIPEIKNTIIVESNEKIQKEGEPQEMKNTDELILVHNLDEANSYEQCSYDRRKRQERRSNNKKHKKNKNSGFNSINDDDMNNF